jgi:hypothetical protein
VKWDHFWTILAQLAIFALFLFIVAAAVAGIIEHVKESARSDRDGDDQGPA